MKTKAATPSLTATLLVLSALTVVGCTGGKDKTNIEIIQDMMDQQPVKAQEYDDFFEDKAGGARVPPEHTKPIGFKEYRYAKDLNGAAAQKNPFAGNSSDEVLLTGQKFYETNCMVCHGQKLKGDGPVAEKMPLRPPALDTAKIRGWTDGQIYHVITIGQGVMGPYASHIPQKYRWQVVNYIRYLQQNQK